MPSADGAHPHLWHQLHLGNREGNRHLLDSSDWGWMSASRAMTVFLRWLQKEPECEPEYEHAVAEMNMLSEM